MAAMIPDIQAAILCDDIRQERNGKFILIGLFDRIGLQRFPFRYPRLCLFTRWCSGEGQFVQSTRILGPNENIVAKGKSIPVRLSDQNRSATNVEVFLNIEIPSPGPYSIEILLDGDLKLRFPLAVHQLHPPITPGPQHHAPQD